MAKEIKNKRQSKQQKCKHNKWHVSGYYKLTGSGSAEERTCDLCGLIITV